MPYRPNTPCRHPGCAALVPYGQKYCEKYKALHPEKVLSAAKHGYGRKWQKASREYLQVHPLCVLCMKKQPSRYVKATVVDHITPYRGDPKLFWDRRNWRSLCKQCHDRNSPKSVGRVPVWPDGPGNRPFPHEHNKYSHQQSAAPAVLG